MTCRGRVQGGLIVPEAGAKLEEGTEVVIETMTAPVVEPTPESTLGQRLMKFAGAADGLPADLARNHDHYIHGTPRK